MSVLTTDLSPAPDELLKMTGCNCHTDCSSMRCTCKKFNVKCSSVCGEQAAQTQITQSMKKMIQIPTLKAKFTLYIHKRIDFPITNV